MTKKFYKIALFLSLSFIVWGPVNTAARETNEKIAVAADARDADAMVSAVAARAPFILLFDGKGAFLAAHPNPITTDRQAGPALAGWLADKQVRTLIAGQFGPNLTRALETRNIRGVVMSGSAAVAVAAALK